MMNAAELLVKCLETEEIQYIFGVPGEENLDFMDALRRSNIKFITTRGEQAAVFMAATVGRLTGKAGVALSTLGPGAANLLTGVAYAHLGGMPILLLTGQKPIKKSKQGKFQIINVVDIMKPVTKYTATIVSGENVPSMVRQAIKLATAERPGPAHLELPEDIAKEKVSEKSEPIAPVRVRRPAPDPAAIESMIEILEQARRPVIVLSSGANRRLVRKQLRAFIEKTKIPFITTQMGKGVENENSEYFIGTTALSSNDFVHHALNHADVVLMIGHDISEKPPITLVPPKHKVINLNFYPSEVDDVYIPTLEVVGDVSHALWILSEKINPNPEWDFEPFFKIKKALEKNISEHADADDFPMRPERVVSDIEKSIPKETTLALDNGMYKIWVARNFKASFQNSVLLDNALATMGAGLASGIAAKLINKDLPVLVVVGDGGFMMNLGEIETAVRLGIDLVVLILNDNGLGMIRWKQKDMNLPEYALSFGNPDFVKLAESFGAMGYRVKKPDDLSKILSETFKQKGVHIIECPVDYSTTNDALRAITKGEMEDLQ